MEGKTTWGGEQTEERSFGGKGALFSQERWPMVLTITLDAAYNYLDHVLSETGEGAKVSSFSLCWIPLSPRGHSPRCCSQPRPSLNPAQGPAGQSPAHQPACGLSLRAQVAALGQQTAGTVFPAPREATTPGCSKANFSKEQEWRISLCHGGGILLPQGNPPAELG